MASLEHEEFIGALENIDYEACQSCLNTQVARDDFSFPELLQTLPKKELPRLCAGMRNQVGLALTLLHDSEADLMDGTSPQASEGGKDELVESLKRFAGWILAILQADSNSVPAFLLEAATALHDEALLAVPQYPELQEATAKLCLSWWQSGANGREEVIAQLLPFVLVKSLTSGKSADVKRCHQLRAAFPLLDFDDEESSADLRQLLLRAAFCPAFLRLAEGRRFLSGLFNLQVQLTRELGAIMRNQIPAGRKSVLTAYGDILYRAWQTATGACKQEVEEFVQGLMQAGIVAKTPALNAALRAVLDGFHSQKVHAAVDALLLRLYEPLLFRGLGAANAAVRRNSILLLFDAFPLQDPEAEAEPADELLTRQFTAISDGLGDAAPAVRAAAVGGLCGLLNMFWELLPAPVIAGYLKRITGQLVFDGAAPSVRAAALKGLALLTQNPIAQPLLKAMLPGVGRVLCDRSSGVRAAFIDLLAAVQRVSALSVTSLVQPEALLAALAQEGPSVRRRLHRLLLPSYYPDAETGPATVAYLLRAAPAAGIAFCRCLQPGPGGEEMLAREDVEQLASELKDHLLASPPMDSTAASAPAQRQNKGKRKQPEPDPAEEGETPESWQSILLGLAQLCVGREGLGEVIDSHELGRLHDMSPSATARAAVLDIAAGIRATSDLSQRCMQVIRSEPDAVEPIELRATLRLLASTEDRATLLGALGFASGATEDSIDGDQAAVAVDVLLREEDMRRPLLDAAMPLVDTLASQAAQASDCLTDLLRQLGEGDDCSESETAHAATLLLTHARAALHAHLAGHTSCDSVHAALAHSNRLAEAAVGALETLEGSLLTQLSAKLDRGAKRGKQQSDPDVPAALRLVGQAWESAVAALLIAGDAAVLLGWDCTSPVLHGSCGLASKLLLWLTYLPTDVIQGDLFGPADSLSEALGLSARLLCFALRSSNVQDASVDPENAGKLENLAGLVVRLGCEAGGAHAAEVKPFLRMMLAPLGSRACPVAPRRLMGPLAEALGADQNLEATDAGPDVGADENADVNLPASDREASQKKPRKVMDTHATQSNRFLKLFADAAKGAEWAKNAAAEVALDYHAAGDDKAALGAVVVAKTLGAGSGRTAGTAAEHLRQLAGQIAGVVGCATTQNLRLQLESFSFGPS